MCITISPLSSPTASACLWQEAEDSKNTVHSHFPVSDGLQYYCKKSGQWKGLCAVAKYCGSGLVHCSLMPRLGQSHAQVMSVSCPGRVSLMRRSCQSHAQVVSVSCPGRVSLMRRSCQPHAQVVSASCPGRVSLMPKPTGHTRRKSASHLAAG